MDAAVAVAAGEVDAVEGAGFGGDVGGELFRQREDVVRAGREVAGAFEGFDPTGMGLIGDDEVGALAGELAGDQGDGGAAQGRFDYAVKDGGDAQVSEVLVILHVGL